VISGVLHVNGRFMPLTIRYADLREKTVFLPIPSLCFLCFLLFNCIVPA